MTVLSMPSVRAQGGAVYGPNPPATDTPTQVLTLAELGQSPDEPLPAVDVEGMLWRAKTLGSLSTAFAKLYARGPQDPASFRCQPLGPDNDTEMLIRFGQDSRTPMEVLVFFSDPRPAMQDVVQRMMWNVGVINVYVGPHIYGRAGMCICGYFPV